MPPWARQILFGDVDAMYASAAVVADPGLAGKPIAVGGRPPRGIITAASYPARRFGVGSAMPTAHALRLCPDLVLVPPDWQLYRRLHSRMREVTDSLFPATAWSSIDEFYADTTELQSLYPNPRVLGQTVKDALLEATGLRSTVAVATGKTIAKVATDQHKPDGLAIIEPGTEAAFLGPLPIEALPGIGPKTAVTLHRWNVHLIGDLLKPHLEPMLRSLWGTRRFAFKALARGIDSEPLVTDRQPKSMGHETTFEHDTNEVAFLEETLRTFLGDLAHDLRWNNLEAWAFTVKLKDDRFKVVTRHRQFAKPLNYDPRMWPAISSALRSLLVPGTCYRLAGLSLSGLVPSNAGLFDQQTTKAVAALDLLIEKHGPGVIGLGRTPAK